MRTSNGVPDEIADAAARLSGPFSVYVHIPFCLRKCPYCSFYSMPVEEHDRDRYLALAEREIRRFGELLPRDNCAVSTVYVGGGTPTLLSPGEWDVLFGLLKGFLSFFPSAEITAEANPESFSEGHTEVWKKWGVARVSLGVQSFSDADLHWLDRPHDADRARWALKKAVAAGFSVSADLMFGLRGQNLRGWKNSVSEAIGLGVHHISLYQLSIDEGCRWSMNPPEDLPDGYPMYRWSQWYLPRKGFDQYEIASFAKPGHHCRHNLSYWTNAPVLAIGAGAWGYLGNTRYRNGGTIKEYGEAVEKYGCGAVATESLEPEKAFREAAVLLLRTKWGISFRDYSAQYGEEALRSVILTLRNEAPQDCIDFRGDSLALTRKGMRVANSIWSLII